MHPNYDPGALRTGYLIYERTVSFIPRAVPSSESGNPSLLPVDG